MCLRGNINYSLRHTLKIKKKKSDKNSWVKKHWQSKRHFLKIRYCWDEMRYVLASDLKVLFHKVNLMCKTITWLILAEAVHIHKEDMDLLLSVNGFITRYLDKMFYHWYDTMADKKIAANYLGKSFSHNSFTSISTSSHSPKNYEKNKFNLLGKVSLLIIPFHGFS